MKQRKALPQITIFVAILALVMLSCSGASDISNLFATATLTPTNIFTSTPSPTFTPSPTVTETYTPSPTPHPTGVNAEEQEDGSLLFIDFDNRYQLLLPPNWAIVFSSQKDLEEAIQNSSKSDPEFANVAENFKDVDPDIFRLAALNVDRKFVETKFPTLLTINAYEDKIASTMPMAFVTAMIEDKILEGSTDTTWDVIDNENNVEVGIVRGTRTIRASGFSVTLQELVISFQANKKLIVMEIASPREFAEEVLTPFEKIIDSIQVNIP